MLRMASSASPAMIASPIFRCAAIIAPKAAGV
jgi:hypothetical protein